MPKDDAAATLALNDLKLTKVALEKFKPKSLTLKQRAQLLEVAAGDVGAPIVLTLGEPATDQAYLSCHSCGLMDASGWAMFNSSYQYSQWSGWGFTKAPKLCTYPPRVIVSVSKAQKGKKYLLEFQISVYSKLTYKFRVETPGGTMDESFDGSPGFGAPKGKTFTPVFTANATLWQASIMQLNAKSEDARWGLHSVTISTI